jgi:NAD(P)-dependent dehydrogenase (short-subunit alcohol dehydrogenase family)
MDTKDQTPPPQHQDQQPGLETEVTPKPEFMPDHPGSGKLRGKVAFITGGDSGIGRAVAVLFAREGARVAVAYLNEHEDAEKTKALVEQEGSECLLLPGDVGDEAYCREAVQSAVDTFGRLDIVVNNAAEQHPQDDLRKITTEQLERTFRTNIFGMFHVTKAALDHLGEGSAIVNSSSVTAYRGSKELIDYASTKGAIIAFTRSLAQALADKNIRVNAVAPGPIWTPLIPATFSEEKVDKFGKQSLFGRPGQPEEVAPSYLFLASSDSSYMTGQTLHPNGGDIVGG